MSALDLSCGYACRVPTDEEKAAFIRDFPEWVAPMPPKKPCQCERPSRAPQGWCRRCGRDIAEVSK